LEEASSEGFGYRGEGTRGPCQWKSQESCKLFKSAILFGTAAFSVGTDQFVIRERLHDIIISAKVHLGFVSEMQKAYSECVEYYSDAYNDNPYALNGSFLHTLIPSYDTEATLLVARRFVNRYASCLYHKHRSGEVRGLYKNATAAGAFRNEWQCSVALSPTEWALRAQGWWDLRELDVDSRELVKIVRKNLKTIRTEAITVMVERKAPQGVKVELNQEASAVKQGTWLELIAFKGGRQVASACAALPKTCHLLHHFVSSFHGRGHVKISQFTGGTASLPHCGTEDSKLRMHIPVLVPLVDELSCWYKVGSERGWRVVLSFLTIHLSTLRHLMLMKVLSAWSSSLTCGILVSHFAHGKIQTADLAFNVWAVIGGAWRVCVRMIFLDQHAHTSENTKRDSSMLTTSMYLYQPKIISHL